MPKRLKRFLLRLGRRPLASKQVLLLLWYRWVDVDLETRLLGELPPGFTVRALSRKRVLRESSPDAVEMPESLDEEIRRDYRRVAYRGLNLWEIAKTSICDELLSTLIDPERDFETIRGFYAKAIEAMHAVEAAYDRYQPDSVVVVQGFQYDMRVAVECARKRSIRTVAIENSFLKDYFFMDDATGAITNRHTLARLTWDRVRARQLTAAQRREVREFLGRAGTTFTHSEGEDFAATRDRLGIPDGKKLVLLLGQVATDAAIVMDSPVYPDQLAFMQQASDAMAAYEETHHLVIRLHPKEGSGASHQGKPYGNRTLARLQEAGVDQLPHVTVIHSDQANTYQLMDHAECGLTLTSQSGLELLTRGKPVLVAGDAFYAGKGFTFDVTRRSQLAATLADLFENPTLTEEQAAGVDNFLYAMCFEYLYPKDLRDSSERLVKLFD